MIYTDKLYIAAILKQARKKKGLKQSQLAEKIGISEKHLSKIETGKNYPALDNFLKMLEVLELSFKDFGIEDIGDVSFEKQKLYKIINSSSKEQLAAYLDVIEALKEHL